ncbi:MAG: poly-beta-hydroxybutyrate polymerase [Rhodospirillaceae bacterium]|nr:poly-beta-hydroxybutyrate polymerase [Rhodospirillaceae bacterium]
MQTPASPKTNRPMAQWPRPLPLHLSLQTMTWLSSLAALSGLKNGSLPWKPGLKKAAANLQKSLAKADPDLPALAAAVDAEACRRLKAFTDGVRRYRDHPRVSRRARPEFWAQGSTRVLDYGIHDGPGLPGAPVLVVPSLINRGTILDLTEKQSLMRHLAGEGFWPFLVEWGAPGEGERDFDLSDYIGRRLEKALDEICRTAGQAPAVVGYCMGGNLALALTVRKPVQVGALALLATPWDFHAGPAGTVKMLKVMAPGLMAMIGQLGELPVDVLQAMFASLDPYQTTNKFQRFAALRTGSGKARQFVALEDWLNDGVPLVGPVAEECLIGWYVENTPAKGAWKVGGAPVLPAEVKAPALIVIPSRDHIVPVGSATALADAIPEAERMILAAGHIGMMAGSRAPAMLYKPLTKWLKETLTEVK